MHRYLLRAPQYITTASTRFAHPLNLMNVTVHISEINQSRGSLDSAVTFWMCPKCGAVVIGFGEPYNLACKVTSQIRFIRFLEQHRCE